MSQQEERDIDRWTAEKLQQFVEDSLMRYKLIGMSRGEAMSHVTYTLMVITAGMVGHYTDASIMDASAVFARLMIDIRKKEGREINLGMIEEDD